MCYAKFSHIYYVEANYIHGHCINNYIDVLFAMDTGLDGSFEKASSSTVHANHASCVLSGAIWSDE